MASIEKSTITISTAAAVIVAVIGIGGGIVGNYWATRSAVQLELNQIKNDLRQEVSDLEHADEIIRMKIAANTDAIATLRIAIKPEEPKLKKEDD